MEKKMGGAKVLWQKESNLEKFDGKAQGNKRPW